MCGRPRRYFPRQYQQLKKQVTVQIEKKLKILNLNVFLFQKINIILKIQYPTPQQKEQLVKGYKSPNEKDAVFFFLCAVYYYF
jgi:hypothetical protein